jgi:hypothetical protein
MEAQVVPLLSLPQSAWATIAAVATAIGLAIAWCIDHARKVQEIARLKAETGKLTAEAVKAAFESMEKIAIQEREYRKAHIDVSTVASALNELLLRGASIDEIGSKREELCRLVLERAVPEFITLMRYEDTFCRSTEERLLLVRQDIEHELSDFASWLRIINHPVLLSALKRVPATIDRTTFRPLHSIVNRLPEHEYADANAELVEAIGNVVDAGKLNDSALPARPACMPSEPLRLEAPVPRAAEGNFATVVE